MGVWFIGENPRAGIPSCINDLTITIHTIIVALPSANIYCLLQQEK